MKSHYQIIVIGAGTAGMMVASQLLRKNKTLDIAIIDPSEQHYYQPAWTLVGAGTYNYARTAKPTKSLIPAGAEWIQDAVNGVWPEELKLSLRSGQILYYDYLVVAPGLVYDFSLIEGLEDALDKGVVCSNYIDPNYTFECLQKFKGGNAVFTQPNTPIKCGGAPQKAMYMSADYLHKKGLDKKSNIVFATPGTVIFGLKKVADTLMGVIRRYGAHFRPYYAPVRIDADQKIVYFKYLKPEGLTEEVKNQFIQGENRTDDQLIAMSFDLLHLAPPQVAPNFVRESPLSGESGWMEVDIHSMQHKQYPNIFGLGDVAALPTAKTGAAIRKQAPVVVDNILNMIAGKNADNTSYTGYSSCPLVTGYGKMVLAEFNYKNEFTPDPNLKKMLIYDSYKEHWRLWILKKYMLPYLYWNKMMKGKDV